jgi:tetratricopeptide (TPR) repeat protein
VSEVTLLLVEAFALHQAGRLAEVEQTYNRILATQLDHFDSLQDYAEALSGRGNVLQELRRFEEALASYDRAVAVRPDYVQAHANRGDILNGLERFEEALASYDRAVAIHPDFADAHALRRRELS